MWHDDDFNKLLSTGIMFCDAAYPLMRIRSEKSFLFELKNAVDILPFEPYPHNMKKVITEYVKNEIGKMNQLDLIPKKHKNHNEIVEGPGKDMLYNLGCRFVTSEAVLEKNDKNINKKGLRIDVYGWKDDTSVIGIEIKTRFSDYEEALLEGRFDRYLDYCTTFYIMTTEYSIFKSAKKWCSRHKATGAILLDAETFAIQEATTLKSNERKTTPKMIKKMHEVFAAKMKKKIDLTCFSSSINTPSAALEHLLNNLLKEIKM